MIFPQGIAAARINPYWPERAGIATRNLRSNRMSIAMENGAAIRSHKGIGIASFAIGVISVIVFLALIAVAAVMAKTGKMTPELNVIIGLGMITACFVDLIGIGLGCFGAVDRASKKTYPALGLILNIGILVLFAALIVIGLSIKGH
jgi:hypothetical protein